MSVTNPIKNAVLLAGPTASGKSALALELARQTGGVIVNADSMQVYDVLSILTARPDDKALQEVPHLLYGHVDPSLNYSVAAWLEDVERLSNSDAFWGRTPIFVGGTGLYFTSLTLGLSEMPSIPTAVRERWREYLSEVGPIDLHRLLGERDPVMALRLQPGDGQKIVRALEVLEATGQSISKWQEQRRDPLVDTELSTRIVVDLDRDVLFDRINQRFDQMLLQGAVREAEAIGSLALNPSLPVMKAIGVRELLAFVDGEQSIEEAATLAKAATRRYAKRQMTWFRNQFGSDWERR